MTPTATYGGHISQLRLESGQSANRYRLDPAHLRRTGLRGRNEQHGNDHRYRLHPYGRRFAYYVNGSFAGFTLDLPGGLRAGGQTSGAGVQNWSYPDWLGSARAVGALRSGILHQFAGSQAYAPFGETYAQYPGLPAVSLFTNQSNDEASDLYDFPAREEHRVQGRWLSPDPAGLAAADPSSPQSWNRYAYVLNNPLSLLHLTGLDCVYLNDSGTSVDVIEKNNDQTDCWNSGGFYAPGTVLVGQDGQPMVQTFSYSDNILIATATNGDVATTLASSITDGNLTAFSHTFGGAPTDIVGTSSNTCTPPFLCNRSALPPTIRAADPWFDQSVR